jgi:hypothetical protein
MVIFRMCWSLVVEFAVAAPTADALTSGLDRSTTGNHLLHNTAGMSGEATMTPRDRYPANRIPLWLKIAYTGFIVVLVPTYWTSWGPANFLWFCDVAVLVTLPALWLESSLLASMEAVGIVLLQVSWIADFLWRVATGRHLTGLTEYMFDPGQPLFTRGLSLFHAWLPFLLLWLVWRLGYDRRALAAQTLLAWVVLVLSYLAVAGPTGPAGNINKVFGPNDREPQTFVAPALWLLGLMVFYPLCLYAPSHLLFRWLMPQPDRPATSPALGISPGRPPDHFPEIADGNADPRGVR